jgi:hypothetical protein
MVYSFDVVSIGLPIIIQSIVQHFTAAMELGLVTAFYTTLTIEERQRSQAARCTFYWYVFHATLA